MDLLPPQLAAFMPFTMVFLFMFSLAFAILRRLKLFKGNKNAAVIISLAIAWFVASSTFVIDFVETLMTQLGIFFISGLFIIFAVFSFMPKLKGFGSWILVPVILIVLAIIFNSLSQTTGVTPMSPITVGEGEVSVMGVHLSSENITLLIIAVIVLVFIGWAYQGGGEGGGKEFKIKLFE